MLDKQEQNQEHDKEPVVYKTEDIATKIGTQNKKTTNIEQKQNTLKIICQNKN